MHFKQHPIKILQECGCILCTSNLPKPNLTKGGFIALPQLNSNRNILILKANKGIVSVVMNSFNYHYKMLNILSSSSYNPLTKNPLKSMTNEATKAIKSSSFDTAIQNIIIPLNPITPRIYGQPKSHKKDIPLRPIVSAIGGPTYALSRFLAKKLHPFFNHSSSFIKESSNFIQQIKHLELDEYDIMVSFNVVSLFTKILVPKAIDLISKLIKFEILKLIKIFLTTTFFSFEGVCYE